MAVSYDKLGDHVVLASYVESGNRFMLAVDVVNNPHALCLMAYDVCALKVASEAEGGIIVDRTFTVNAGDSNAVIQMVNKNGDPIIQLTTDKGLNFEQVEGWTTTAAANNYESNKLISARVVHGNTVLADGLYFLKAMPASGPGDTNITTKSNYPGAQIILEGGCNTFIGSGSGGTNLYNIVKKATDSSDEYGGDQQDLFLSAERNLWFVNHAKTEANIYAMKFSDGYLNFYTAKYPAGTSEQTLDSDAPGIRFYVRNATHPLKPAVPHSSISPRRARIVSGGVYQYMSDGIHMSVMDTLASHEHLRKISTDPIACGFGCWIDSDGTPAYYFTQTNHKTVSGSHAFRLAAYVPYSNIADSFETLRGMVDNKDAVVVRVPNAVQTSSGEMTFASFSNDGALRVGSSTDSIPSSSLFIAGGKRTINLNPDNASGDYAKYPTVFGILPIAFGGTGATSVNNARIKLGFKSGYITFVTGSGYYVEHTMNFPDSGFTDTPQVQLTINYAISGSSETNAQKMAGLSAVVHSVSSTSMTVRLWNEKVSAGQSITVFWLATGTPAI